MSVPDEVAIFIKYALVTLIMAPIFDFFLGNEKVWENNRRLL